MSRKFKFYLMVGLQVLFLGLIIGFKGITLITGKTVLLETVPVDPRSLFRGDYVILNYKISRLDLNKVSTNYRDFRQGDTVYIVLREAGKFWTAKSVSKTKPVVRNGEVYIKGKVTRRYDNTLMVEYGIESYFVPEGAGKEIERARNARRISVKVAVNKSGNAIIKQILVDDKPLRFR